jgi:hypothetical protein
MKAIFSLGWVFLAAGFISVMAETSARLSTETSGAIVSASELWNALSPGTFIAAQNLIEGVSSVLWDPILLGIMFLPAWLIFGGPGAAMAWLCQPNRHKTGIDDDISSLSVYDDLSQFAKEEGYDKGIDDMAPSFGNLDWGHDEKAMRTGRGIKQEDMGEESALFTDALAKNANAGAQDSSPKIPSKGKLKGKPRR